MRPSDTRLVAFTQNVVEPSVYEAGNGNEAAFAGEPVPPYVQNAIWPDNEMYDRNVGVGTPLEIQFNPTVAVAIFGLIRPTSSTSPVSALNSGEDNDAEFDVLFGLNK